MDSELSLELPNSSTSRDELGALGRGQAALKSAVDSVLPAPAVDRLVADTQVAGNVLDAASSCDEVQHPLTKLRGVAASSHAVLQCRGGTAAWRIPIIRLHEIQGALIARTGLDVDSIKAPAGGRAPGWDAGVLAASKVSVARLALRKVPGVDQQPEKFMT